MDTSQDLLQEETLVIINFTFFIFICIFFLTFLVLVNTFDPTITIPYSFKQCTTDVHYGSFRICHQAFGGI